MADEIIDDWRRIAASLDDSVRNDAAGLLMRLWNQEPPDPNIAYANGRLFLPFTPEDFALATAAAIFSKAFLETLGRRAGEGAANLPERVRDLVRKRRHDRGGDEEIHVGVENGGAATVVVKNDLPDEARLALLDLDVTAEDLRGKLLRWDQQAMVWRPDDSEA